MAEDKVNNSPIFLIEISDHETGRITKTTLQGLEAAEEFVREFNERFKGEQFAKIFRTNSD